MPASYDSCTSVSSACPVSATTYGYRPNLAANAILLSVFAACTIAHLALGIRHRTVGYLIATTASCILEIIGYVGRILMHSNPWSSSGFRIQIVCLIIAPSFLAAGIYLDIKHLLLRIGPQASRLPPHLYPWIFVGCDAVSILTQAAGGGLAGSGKLSLIDTGNDILLAGIVIQVATMAGCWLLSVDFVLRLRVVKSVSLRDLGRRFNFYLVANGIAFLCIFIRCVYRIPEMAGGWGSSLQRNETEFLVLDGAMIALASILMAVAHPGTFKSVVMESRQHGSSEKDKAWDGEMMVGKEESDSRVVEQ